ncbi:hypothetical protein [Streptomyces sp. ISL-100]|uniref:hypothetical protein n=1 Tax=Streptomyces sp. ISL-100 TaxID=2819173 RepID=UPI001BEBCB48|nr:hypothetical protein [Streptomyces sp. ISL-100]MBT2401159.1 hypothetical protein [Streptomyces sp. ISL-100]
MHQMCKNRLPHLRPDAVFVQNQGVLLWMREREGETEVCFRYEPGAVLRALKPDPDDLFALVAIFFQRNFADTAVPTWHLNRYMRGITLGSCEWCENHVH